ncbi:tail fiber domain-containing protein [bacterium]|nr:tail fiber domain-containing protein [bacterium]
MTINANGQQSRFGVDESWFNALTDANKFYFNKPVAVSGSILSYNQDTVLGPSNNTDTYLKISSSSDKITAQADEFLVQGDSKYLKVKFTSTAAELRTDASSIYINKPLTVEGGLSMTGGVTVGGSLSVTGNIMTSGWFGRTSHNNGGLVGSYNNVGGNALKTNPIYVIGGNYKPAESSLSNMYGVGYTDGSASFITGNASGWGLYVASDGDARTFLSGSGGGNSYINKNGGNVGIGLDNPIQALDVNGIVSIRGKHMGPLNEWSKRVGLQLHVGVGGDYWMIGPEQEDGDGDLMFTYFNGSGYDSIAYLDPGNDVWYEDSDRRKKKNIEAIGPVLERLKQLEPVRFNLTKHEDGETKKTGVHCAGCSKAVPRYRH